MRRRVAQKLERGVSSFGQLALAGLPDANLDISCPAWLVSLAPRLHPVILGDSGAGAVSTALASQDKPLKRFDVAHGVLHRAEAAVLMKYKPRCEMFGLRRGMGRFGGGRKSANGHQNAMQQRMRIRRTAGNENVHGQNRVHGAHRGIIFAEDPAAATTSTHRHH